MTRKWTKKVLANERFSISNFNELMRPCFFIYKCFGLFPYKVTKTGIKSSKIGLSYSVATAITCIVYLIITLYQSNISRALAYDTIEGLLQFDCYFILGGFISIHAYFSSKRRLHLVENICKVSSILSKKEIKRLAWFIYPKDLIGFSFLIVHIPNVYSTNSEIFFMKILGLFESIIIYLMNSIYTNYILTLRSCFQNINNNLISLQDVTEIQESSIVGKRLQKNIKLIKLRKLELKHHEVSKVVKELNSVFTLQTIATVLLTFAEVTFGLYLFLLHSQGHKGIDVEKQVWYNYFITSVSYHTIKIFIMVWICQETKNESLKTGTIIHDVILNSDNEALKTELNFFSLQLLHCNNDFTSKCLTMDSKLLTAIVSGVATYLLILIQFLKTKNHKSVESKA